MKERPILMTPENAQKCHVGTKTKTRRIINPQPRHDQIMSYKWSKAGLGVKNENAIYNKDNAWCAIDEDGNHHEYLCPYGVVGDRLWVREAWAWPGEEALVYKANPGHEEMLRKWMEGENTPHIKWKPSIHMPKWACRTVLEITEVRVERVQWTSSRDITAEGVPGLRDIDIIIDPENGYQKHFSAWKELWVSINGEASWNANPWVWAITFMKVTE